MIELKSISKDYVTANQKVVHALNNISIRFPDTGLYAICGKSGSGKTTFLNMLGLLDKPSKGEIIYQGKDILALGRKKQDEYRQKVAFVFQDYNLLNEYTVEENVQLPLRLLYLSEADIQKRTQDILREVGLQESGERNITELSGGQQQRVVIARALAQNTEIILCDEPTGNLDSETANDIFSLLKKMSKNCLVLVVTHDRLLSTAYADRVISLTDGILENMEEIPDECIEDALGVSCGSGQQKKNVGTVAQKWRLKMKLSLDTMKNAKAFSVFAVVLIVFSLSVLTLFSALSEYSSSRALALSLLSNDEKIIRISKYFDQSLETADGIIGGVFHVPDMLTEQDIPKIRTLVGNNVPVYAAYYYTTCFSDFANVSLPFEKADAVFLYHQFMFRELITVDDFSTFPQKIKYGTVPKDDCEILIYDYMAENLCYYGVVDAKNCEEVVGKELHDRTTGATFRISGILLSHAADYAYVEEKGGNLDFEETYLSSLQCIIAFPGILDSIEPQLFPSYPVFAESSTKSEDKKLSERIESGQTRLKYVLSNDLQFLWQNDSCYHGIILTKSQAESLFSVSMNEEAFQQLLSEGWEFCTLYYLTDCSLEKSYYSDNRFVIKGIVADGTEIDGRKVDDDTILFVSCEDERYLVYEDTKDFRGVYIGLGDDWKQNERLFDSLKYPEAKPEKFYLENIGYFEDGFTEYTSLGILVEESDDFFLGLKDIMRVLTIFVIVLTVPCLIFFVWYFIRKNTYKIGLLKSMGLSDKNLAFVFLLVLFLLMIVSIFISVIVSVSLINMVNQKFADSIQNARLVFFNMHPAIFWRELLYCLGFISAAACITGAAILVRSPATLIRQNKNR